MGTAVVRWMKVICEEAVAQIPMVEAFPMEWEIMFKP